MEKEELLQEILQEVKEIKSEVFETKEIVKLLIKQEQKPTTSELIQSINNALSRIKETTFKPATEFIKNKEKIIVKSVELDTQSLINAPVKKSEKGNYYKEVNVIIKGTNDQGQPIEKKLNNAAIIITSENGNVEVDKNGQMRFFIKSNSELFKYVEKENNLEGFKNLVNREIFL